MVALSRCLGSLALLVGSAVGARISKKRGENAGTKFIAGVPVLNYHAAYKGESLGEFGAEEEWVVVVRPGVTNDQIQEMCRAAKHGCKLWGNPSQGGVPFFEMRGTESDLEAVIASGHGSVKYVEPDSEVFAIPELRAGDVENGLWGLDRVASHSRSSQGAGVTVFVLDTGVRITHQDFGGRATPGFDLTSGSLVECGSDMSCAGDRQGHGSHCAGTAAGTNYGVAPGASIRSGKVLSDQGSGQWSWSYSALNWLATSSIRPVVASMSLGGSGTQQAMADAVDAATNAGVSVVVAGGNSNSDACNFSPAFVPSAITVGSTTSNSARSSFSNYGACTNLWAPGSSIMSVGISSDTATATLSGTSMACPHVSGGAALILEQNPTFNYAKVLERLQADARINSITDLKAGDINAELYVGSDAPPPAGGVTPPPTPAPLPPGQWELSGSGCVMSGNCISSKNHPSSYGNNEACTVQLGAIPLAVDAFRTESGYDILSLGGRDYSGSSGPAAGTYSGAMSWTSDYSVTNTGWKLCRTDQANVAAVAGSCTTADFEQMDRTGAGPFAEQMADCGRNTLNWLLQWQKAAFIACAEGKGLSNPCAGCFELSGKHGYDNCKGACMFSWCSSGCLSCIGTFNPTLEVCTGRTTPIVTPC